MSFVAKTLAASAAMLALSMPVAAQAPELAMLDRLARGAWVIDLRSEDDTSRICVRTGREFIQLRHRGQRCDSFVVQDEPGEVTVQYRCPGNGYGRTTIRREGSQLVQLRSQGIERGEPFSIEGEARRVGSC